MVGGAVPIRRRTVRISSQTDRSRKTAKYIAQNAVVAAPAPHAKAARTADHGPEDHGKSTEMCFGRTLETENHNLQIIVETLRAIIEQQGCEIARLRKSA